jgi:hypothetical protein
MENVEKSRAVTFTLLNFAAAVAVLLILFPVSLSGTARFWIILSIAGAARLLVPRPIMAIPMIWRTYLVVLAVCVLAAGLVVVAALMTRS